MKKEKYFIQHLINDVYRVIEKIGGSSVYYRHKVVFKGTISECRSWIWAHEISTQEEK